MGKSTHAGFNGERAATPAAGDSPSSPLNPGRQQHLANAASAGCQGAVGTVAGSQESGWSHPGTAGSRPRRRHQPQGWHRALSPPGSCCLLFQAFLDCPVLTLLWSLARVSAQAAWADPAVPPQGQLCPQGLQRAASRCPSWHF